MKKGQTEVIGLLIIVILFILILFFFIGFSSNNQGDDELRESVESSSLLRAIMFYTPKNAEGGLCGKQIREIAGDCRPGNNICGFECEGLLRQEIGNILEKGLDGPYSYALSTSSYEIMENSGDCTVGIVDIYNTRELKSSIRIC